MRTTDFLPPTDVCDEHAGADDVLEPGAGLLQSSRDTPQHLTRLGADVIAANSATAFCGRCRGGN